MFNEYIMNPRVANEFLTPYKSFFAANIEPSLAKQAVENPQALVDWVKNNVSINERAKRQRIPIMPDGCMEIPYLLIRAPVISSSWPWLVA